MMMAMKRWTKMTIGTKPTIGRIVIYRSKIDNGPGNDVLSPAIVTRTRNTTVKDVIDRWGPEPHEVTGVDGETFKTAEKSDRVVNELESDEHIDLAVFGMGQTYREYNVGRGSELGQWEWPQLMEGQL
jgi:hypothetical protein